MHAINSSIHSEGGLCINEEAVYVACASSMVTAIVFQMIFILEIS